MDTAEINIENILRAQGLLAGQMEHYEYRPQQLKMAEAVKTALSNERHLIVEADTGVGKSIAYLIPGILWAVREKKKVVISTNTINLQEQLVYKDIPLLKKILPEPFNVVLVKGRNNYLCLRRFQKAVDDEVFLLIDLKYRKGIKKLKKWVKHTIDGSLSDIDEMPDRRLWNEICSELDNCMGKKCPFYNACFFQRARQRVYKADLMIVNHHLFFSDLALRQAGAAILPNYNAVILDEAHFIEEIATSRLGFEISNLSVKYLLNRLYNPRQNKGILLFIRQEKAVTLVKGLHEAADDFFYRLYNEFKKINQNIISVSEPGMIPNALGSQLLALYKELKRIKKNIGNDELRLELSSFMRRTLELTNKLDAFSNHLLEEYVYWTELEGGWQRMPLGPASKSESNSPAKQIEVEIFRKKRNKPYRIVLRAFPVVAAKHLKSLLFDNIKTVILTGATISVNKSFDYFKGRVGLNQAVELRLGSSFNYKEQMKIYVPANMPSPNDADKYKDALAVEIKKFLDYSEGKAFVLFTNYSLMQEEYKRIAPLLRDNGIQCFIQGAGIPRSLMLKQFRQDTHSVLFGTDSFWTGVDVEGEALSNVIITRLPFAVPNHPLMSARLSYIEEQGGNAFRDYSLPQAVIKLRQGIGRLIRRRTDNGIIVILDNRIITKSYGRQFWSSLPDCPRIIE